MIDLQLLALLLTPLLGGLLLAAFGSRSWAAELNSLMSFCTFIAAVVLTVRVIDSGPQVAFGEQFFIDQFNVFLVALTAFVAFTTSLFSRPYMRIEQHHGKLTTPMLHLYYSMYQLFTLAMLVALTSNNMGIIWVAMEAATLTTVLLVSLYRTPASIEAAWKYFILCGWASRSRCSAPSCCISPPSVCSDKADRFVVDAFKPGQRQFGTHGTEAGVRVFTGRLRHQNRSGTAAQLVAGCPRGRPTRYRQYFPGCC